MDNTKFWLCWNPNRGIPKKKHETFEEAQKEGARLAQMEDSQVAILECVGFVRRSAMPAEWVPTVPPAREEAVPSEELPHTDSTANAGGKFFNLSNAPGPSSLISRDEIGDMR